MYKVSQRAYMQQTTQLNVWLKLLADAREAIHRDHKTHPEAFVQSSTRTESSSSVLSINETAVVSADMAAAA